MLLFTVSPGRLEGRWSSWRLIIFICAVFLLVLPAIADPELPGDVGRKRLVVGGSSVEDDVSNGPRVQSPPPHEARHHTKTDIFDKMIDALGVMQDQYFQIWNGVWPSAIDWTAAVMGTYVSAAMITMSRSTDYVLNSGASTSRLAIAHENLINRYFSQLISFYFGQDVLALRQEAYDDMLWVVLGWLESIKFVKIHAGRHYRDLTSATSASNRYSTSWYGEQWIPSFAHRARIFWEIASRGWDTSLCDGGMVWSPYLGPYKNAITNELYIAASISMYLYFPGDDNPEPFIHGGRGMKPIGPQDPKFLQAAVEGYKWLIHSNMTDDMGLFTDGFHISGYDPRRNSSHSNTKCDTRNEMIYTYNQGVLLTGQRGLWEATGARSYLEDGHVLIKNVINATGYNLENDKPYERRKKKLHGKPGRPSIGDWYGLGRDGILEDACDAFGYCSQDGQTFKGIFFHHLATFCSTLPPHFVKQPGATFDIRAFHDVKVWHGDSCARYGGWIRHNAKAAVRTKDEEGRFGAWWGAPSSNETWIPDAAVDIPADAVDYRNEGVPKDDIWRGLKAGLGPVQPRVETSQQQQQGQQGQQPLKIDDLRMSPEADISHNDDVEKGQRKPVRSRRPEQQLSPPVRVRSRDWNDRGRGRTVETQGGGVSVLRALWEVVELKPEQAVHETAQTSALEMDLNLESERIMTLNEEL